MRSRRAIYLVTVILLLSVTGYGQETKDYIPPDGPGFNVIELFTSEGCYTCPAAEKAMVQLAKEYKHNFYTLEFHVNYWDYLSWKDKYAQPEFTKRQEHYAELFRCRSIYTPQAVINGMIQEVGSDKAKMRPYLNRFVLLEPQAWLSVSATAHMDKVFVSYTADYARGQLLNVALVQNKVVTDVLWGENAHKVLKHTNVVRDFKVVDLTEDHGFVEVYLPPGIVAEECSIIAYTQTDMSWVVTSVAKCAISPENH